MPTDSDTADAQHERYRTLNRYALIFAALVAVGATIASIPVLMNVREKQHASTCTDNGRGTGHWLRTLRERGEDLPAVRDVRDYLAHYGAGDITVHSPSVFVCPGDDAAVGWKDAITEYPDGDLTDREFIASHFSYAVRDLERFPIEEGDDEAILLCDRQGLDGRTPHHPGGICVVRADGASQFMDNASLGFAPDEPIVVGPASPHPELKKMIFLRDEK